MKKKQVAAILLSAIMSVSACLPASNISAFAAESTAEIAAVEEVTSSEDASAASEESDDASTVDVSSEGSDIDPNEDVEPVNEQADNEQVNTDNSGDGETEVETAQEEAASEDVVTGETAAEDSSEIEAVADAGADTATVAEMTEAAEEEEAADESVKKGQKSGAGNDFSTAIEVPVDGSINGQINTLEEFTYYYFIPDETRMYTIIGYSGDGFSFNGQAYDYNHGHLASSCDWNRFELEIMCAAGQRYYIRVCDDFMEGQPYNYTLSVTKKDISFCAEAHDGSTHNVLAGEPVTLSIDAYSTAPISYSWSRDGVEVSTEETYTFTPEQECTVQCDVSSEGGSEHIVFYISVDNQLVARGNYTYSDAEEAYVAEIRPDGTPELHVNVTAIDTEGLSYQWKEDGSTISGATSPTYTPEVKNGTYCCKVSDKFGNTANVYFVVKIDNRLSAYFEGYPNQDSIEVAAGASVTLKAIANAIRTDNIQYSWYSWDLGGNLSGATSDTFTIDSVNKSMSISCTVTDKYGNDSLITLNITIDNNLKVYDGETNNSGKIYLSPAPGETLNLSPVIEMNDSQGVAYQWYELNYFYGDFEDGEWERINGANDTSYSVTPSREKEAYELIVTDRFNNRATIKYYITLENNLKVYPEGNNGSGCLAYITLQPGESTTLKTIVTAANMNGITYRWYIKDGDKEVLLEGENTDTLSTPVNHTSFYSCKVTDMIGTTDFAMFEVTVDNGLTVSPEGNSAIQNCSKTVRIDPGSTAVLRAIVNADESEGLEYVWYKDGSLIDGATGSSYEASGDLSAVYKCEVSDQYGNKGEAVFNVIINNRLIVYPEGARNHGKTSTLYSTPAEGMVLRTIVSAFDMDSLTYRWSAYKKIDEYTTGWQIIEGAESPQYMLTEDDVNTVRYKCEVSDVYGNKDEAIFQFANPDSAGMSPHFKAYPEGAEIDPVTGDYYYYVNINSGTEVEPFNLKAIVETDHPDTIVYEWRDAEWHIIDSETDSIVVSPERTTSYTCVVKDKQDSLIYKELIFRVIKNSFNARTEGMEGYDYDLSYANINLLPGQEYTLRAIVDAEERDGITYSWYMDGNESTLGAEDCLTITATSDQDYFCTVRDNYGNYANLEYHVHISDFSIRPKGADKFESPDTAYVYKVPGEDRVLSVEIDGDTNAEYTYEWIYVDPDINIPEKTISTDSTYLLNDDFIDRDFVILCVVKNQYGTSKRIRFKYTLNHLDAYGDTEDIGHVNWTWGDYYYLHKAKRGIGCNLKVNVTADDLSKVTYKWYEYRETKPNAEYEEERYSSYVIASGTDNIDVNPDGDGRYCCEVLDGYGNSKWVYYLVKVDENLTVTPADIDGGVYNSTTNRITLNADAGRQLTLGADATISDNSELFYTWQSKKLEGINNADNLNYGWTIIGTGADSIQVTVDENTRYECVVHDQYGNIATASYDILVDEIVPAERIEFSEPELRVLWGSTMQLKPTVYPENVTVKALNWKSSDIRIVRVDRHGTITADNRDGVAYVTAASDDGSVSATCKIIVKKSYLNGPVIVKQPVDVTAQNGEKVRFRVIADGNIMTYRWEYRKAGGTSWRAWTGKTEPEAFVTATSLNDGYSYRCIISDGIDSVTSEPAVLTLYKGPVFITQPEDCMAENGEQVTFRAEASGENVSYQWEYSTDNGENWIEMEGETGTEITVEAGDDTDGNLYRCVAGNGTESIASEAAKLSVSKKPVITRQPEDVTAKAGDKAVFHIEATGSDGEELSYQWEYKKTESGSWRTWTGKTSADASATAGTGNNGFYYRCVVTGGSGSVTSDEARLTLCTGPVITKQPEDVTVKAGEKATFRVEASGNEGEELSYQWEYKKTETGSWRVWSGKTSAEATATANTGNNGFYYRCVVTGASGSVTSEEARLTLYAGPVITKQPEDVTAIDGQKVTFRIEATGNEGEELSYQWEYRKTESGSWRVWTGKTSAEATATAGSSNNGFQYRCKVSNNAGTAVSEPVRLTLQVGIKIIYQPEDVESPAQKSVEFSIVAEGENLTYQWEYSSDNGESWSNCEDGNYAKLYANASQDTFGNLYHCIVSNSEGSVTSESATLRERKGPRIIMDPEDALAPNGKKATFKVQAEDTEGRELSYQWEYKRIGSESWREWVGKTDAEAKVTAGPGNNGFLYRCKVSNGVETSTSRAAILRMYEGPIIIEQPEDFMAVAGNECGFWPFIIVLDEDDLEIQWQYSTDNGANWLDFNDYISVGVDYVNFVVTEEMDGNLFRCIYSDSYGSVTSDAARCSIYRDLCFTLQPESVMAEYDETVTFRAEAVDPGNEGELDYEWWRIDDNGMLSFMNYDQELILVAREENEHYQYICRAISRNGYIDSEPVTITINKTPQITVQPENVVDWNFYDEPAEFYIEATAHEHWGELRYQWQYSTDGGENWNDCEGENEPLLAIDNSMEADGNLYRCAVSNDYETAISNSASLSIDRKPCVIRDPGSTHEWPGTIVTFTVVAMGPESGGELHYQWQRFIGDAQNVREDCENPDSEDWINCEGMTGTEMTVEFTGEKEEFFRCVISNNYGSVCSRYAVMTFPET